MKTLILALALCIPLALPACQPESAPQPPPSVRAADTAPHVWHDAERGVTCYWLYNNYRGVALVCLPDSQIKVMP